MKLVTSEQMRWLDRQAIERHGIPSLDLMERAGKGVADEVVLFLGKGKGPVSVVSGKGGNGGDGLVAARHLIESGLDVLVFLLSRSHELNPDARANWERLVPLSARIFQINDTAELNSYRPQLMSSALVVDAIFGSGLDREASGLPAQAIAAINALSVPVVSIDIPSGLSSDDGKILGICVRAQVTVTLGLPKKGLFLGVGSAQSGRVVVVDIGIPPEDILKVETDLELIEPSIFRASFKKRDPQSHKGTYGHVAVFAGSLGHLGAGYLSCMAALRSGAGLATYFIPAKAFVRFDARYPEIMCNAIADDGAAFFHPKGLNEALKSIEEKSVVAIGPAIGTEKPTRDFVNDLVRKARVPLVIDADGLRCLDLDSLKGRKYPTILTPHPGEMASLMKSQTDKIQGDRIGSSRHLASMTGAIVVLKGKGTIVGFPHGTTFINSTGNAGMATAGMGDALTGVIAAFIAQGLDPKTACLAGVYIHGLAGDLAVAEHGERSLITSDVIGRIGAALRAGDLR